MSSEYVYEYEQVIHFYQKNSAYEDQYVCMDDWKFQYFELWRRYRKWAICSEF